MIKIFLTVRNRLGITVKCLEAIRRHTTVPYQIYVYNNQTNYLIGEHFKYFCKLYTKGLITQITFNTNDSTFNAFSKASACNMFGLQHEQDPKKKDYEFLLMLDNDIILTPKWNKHLSNAWNFVNKNNLKNIKVIGQLPGGIKSRTERYTINDKLNGVAGHLGGSGLWSVQTDFFTDVGILDLKQLVGHNKMHDQHYWRLLHKATGGKSYIMGINQKLGIHCGRLCGSICNTLTRQRCTDKALEHIKFSESDENIKKMDFDTFYQKILDETGLIKDW